MTSFNKEFEQRMKNNFLFYLGTCSANPALSEQRSSNARRLAVTVVSEKGLDINFGDLLDEVTRNTIDNMLDEMETSGKA